MHRPEPQRRDDGHHRQPDHAQSGQRLPSLHRAIRQGGKEGIADITERVLKGLHTRLRPVIITAAVASLGFFANGIVHFGRC